MDEIIDIVEAKYINIKWADKSSSLKIIESKDAINSIKTSTNNFTIEATTFTKIDIVHYGQLAFRILDNSLTSSPYFLKATGEKSYLIKVKDNATNKVWWVEGDKWSKSNKRWESEIFRSAGNVKLNVGQCCITIRIGSCSFSYNQLKKYLQDFKNDLWYLILHETSYISAPVKEKKTQILDVNSVQYFYRFNGFAAKVLEQPKSELREIQELKNIKQVKPTPRTFMEIATIGYKKQLTSRAYKPSYNVPENKYVLYIVNRIVNLLKNLDKVTEYVDSSLTNRRNIQERRLKSFSDKIKINREAVVSEYNELKHKIKQEKTRLIELLNNQKETYEDVQDVFYTITLGRNLTNSKDFFIQKGFSKLDNGYYQVSFDEIFNSTFKEYGTYEIQGKVTYKIIDNPQGKNKHLITFHYIDQIILIDSTLEKKLSNIEAEAINLKNNNWERPITNQERKDQVQEKLEIEKSIDTLTKGLKSNKETSVKLIPALNQLRRTQKELVKLNIKPSSLLPSSMSFIQNPNYQGVHKLYKVIQELSGVDEQLFDGLEEAESIGILNISLIYERWCFLQIVKTLVDKFKFTPEINWKQKLLNQIINSDPNDIRNVKIHFENKNTSRKITLWYEKVLESGKRPDFVVDLISDFNPINTISKRLVLDAKFYENIDERGGISEVINDLYVGKNYSENNNNKVIILHPSPNSVTPINTPQDWAKDTYLGETKLLYKDDNELPDHNYGAVLLSPIVNQGKYLDSLQMCLGMFLQYGVENNKLEEENYNEWVNSQIVVLPKGINPLSKEKVFCLVCGGHEHSFQVNKTLYGVRWELTCYACLHKTFYNYCVSKVCRNRLFKHGPYWTYHATEALHPYNIKCPSCSESLDLSK